MLTSPPTSSLEEWTWSVVARDGTPVRIRPPRRDDEQREISFIASLSERSRYLRLFTPLKCHSPQLLRQFMDVDYDRRMALVATIGNEGAEALPGVSGGPPDRALGGTT